MELSEDARLAVVETEIGNLKSDMKEIRDDIKSILSALSQMSGGKRALFALCVLIGTVIGAIGTLWGMAASFLRHS